MEHSQRTKISCIDVPVELLDKNNAKVYFRKFGNVTRLCIRPKSRSCSVEYTNAANAQKALSQAGEYNGQRFIVGWDMQKRTAKKQPKKKESLDPDWNVDLEVQAELNAMANNYPNQYNLRGEKMDVDAAEKVVAKKNRKAEKAKKASTKIQTSNLSIKGSVKSEEKERQELLNILREPAYNPEEKFKILEARDKFVRLYSGRNTDMSKVRTTVGTCPDMCPEKERVMREFQHQVHMFEQETYGREMNHTLAVKQYSRSSADQEVPLHYELRPISILQLTMSYLMHNIMNLCENEEVNIAEWFHFLWDRTRSIRKDITQQELCSEGSVELLEQCARFHIHCSAHLAAEDPSVFDQKINTENLTKCLQTLKYMYHDLKLKGIFCQNESEFRAYIILLNLNDGNFMWEVQQLETEIVKSSPVKFALDVYSAIDKNNYIKFFKLVRSSTYLNACLLLRYFIQIRLKAVNTLLKSYTPRSPFTNFPVDEFARILAFEDVESAVDFLEYYGLYLTPERNHVVLDRKAFFMPECPYRIDKAVNVIESKRQCSVGDVVCGKPLPPPLHANYKPRTSFNANGTFKLQELLKELDKTKGGEDNDYLVEEDSPEVQEEQEAEDQTDAGDVEEEQEEQKALEEGELFDEQDSTPRQQTQTDKQPWLDKFQSDKVNDLRSKLKPPSGGFKFDLTPAQTFKSKSIFPSSSVTSTLTSTPTPKPTPNFTSISNTLPLPTINFYPQQKINVPKLSQQNQNIFAPAKLASPQIVERKLSLDEEIARKKEQERQREDEKRRQREEIERKRQAEEDELRKKLLLQQRMARERQLEIERKLAIEKERALKLERELAEQRRRKLLEIKTTVKDVMDDLIQRVEETAKQEKLSKIAQSIRNYKMRQMFKKWHNKTKLNKRKRKAVDQCPLWIYSKSLQEEAEELYTTTQDDTLKDMKRYKKGKPDAIKVYQEAQLDKIDLKQLTFNILSRNFPKDADKSKIIRTRFYWKINISSPDKFETPHSQSLTNIIDQLFDWKAKNDSKIFIEEYRNPYSRVIYCVQNDEGVHNILETNGLIFVTKSVNEYFLKRLKTSLKAFNKFTQIALFFVVENVTKIEHLNFIKTHEGVSTYKIVTTQFNGQNLKDSIENGLGFLASNLNEPPPLELDTLKSFLVKYLVSEPWKRVVSFAKWNRAYKSCLMKPRIVVKLYNEALEHLKSILLDENLLKYGNFPQIFDECLDSKIPDDLPCDYKYFPRFWNTISYRALIEKLLKQLVLPNYTANWPKDGKELEQIVFDYCKKVFKDPQTQFYKIMAVILKSLVNYDNNFSVKVREILWTDVIEQIALEKVLEADFSLKNTPFDKDCVFNDCFVTYNTCNLQEYKTKLWFYVENPVIKEEIDMDSLAEYLPKNKRIKFSVDEFYDSVALEETFREAIAEEPVKSEDLHKTRTEIKNIELLLKDLEESMTISHCINSKFNQTLKNVLRDSDS